MQKRFRKLFSIGILSLSLTIPGASTFAEEAVTETEAITESGEKVQDTQVSETVPPETQGETTPQTEGKEPETSAPETQAPQIEPSTSVPETELPQTTATESIQETSAETEEQTEAVTERVTEPQEESVNETEVHTESPEKESSEKKKDTVKQEQSTEQKATAVKITGFSVDPSKYPSANISENTETIYWYLRNNMGLNHAAACGVLANIHLESNFNPLSLGDGGTSYGICQWHNGRFNNLISYCNGNGLDYNTLTGQLSYMEHELSKWYPGVLNYIKNVPDNAQGAYDAAHYWCVYYETPAHTYERAQQRGNLAKNEYYGKTFTSGEFNSSKIISEIRNQMELEVKTKNIIGEIRLSMQANEESTISTISK